VYERILVPLDGSPAAETVLAVARSLASRLSSELILLRVLEPIPNLPASRYPPEIEEAAREYLRPLADPPAVASLRIRMLVVHGDAAHEIVENARSLCVDLVVLGVHRPRGARRVVRGGVADRVLRACAVPTVVVGVG
jgi:nucleotide-binding universal stress UspA family protein